MLEPASLREGSQSKLGAAPSLREGPQSVSEHLRAFCEYAPKVALTFGEENQLHAVYSGGMLVKDTCRWV